MIKYIKHNWIWVVVLAYFILAFFVLELFNKDIGIPCLWTLIFNSNCWGCGLTHAFYSCLRFDFLSAWNENPLIFVVIPAAAYFIFKDWIEWSKSQR